MYCKVFEIWYNIAMENNTILIDRPEYLAQLKRWRDKDLVKVVSGIRRCGKSTLFLLYQDWLKSIGIDERHILSFNLEDPAYDFETYREFYDYVNNMISHDGRKTYIFIDEVQNLPAWEKAVDGLYIQSDLDVYITGSNAYFLSGELATLLSGRYVEIKMLPLSFKEYAGYYQAPADERLYRRYTERSSFPYALKLDSEEEIDSYLDSLYNTILVKDIVQRRKIANVTALKALTAFLFATIGSTLSVKKISDTMTSDGRPIAVHTVETYLEALTESLIFYKVPRFDLRGRQFLQSGEKYYAADVALRYALLGRKNLDVGHLQENVVYLELIRRGNKVYIGKNTEKEVDFIAENKNGFAYYQVAYSTTREETLDRELSALKDIPDHYPKILLTMDVEPVVDYDGILKINVLDWLMGD